MLIGRHNAYFKGNIWIINPILGFSRQTECTLYVKLPDVPKICLTWKIICETSVWYMEHIEL